MCYHAAVFGERMTWWWQTVLVVAVASWAYFLASESSRGH